MKTCTHCKQHCPECKKLEKITMSNEELDDTISDYMLTGLLVGIPLGALTVMILNFIL